MAKTPARTALISSQSLAANGTIRARLDCSAADGGLLTLRITNQGTGPSPQCIGRVLIAHKDTVMPAAAPEGTGDGDWKQVATISGTTVNNQSTRGQYSFGPEVVYLEVEFGGHAAQPVTVEAIATTYSY